MFKVQNKKRKGFLQKFSEINLVFSEMKLKKNTENRMTIFNFKLCNSLNYIAAGRGAMRAFQASKSLFSLA